MMKIVGLASCLIALSLLIGCSKNSSAENAAAKEPKDNLGTIGKILRTADHSRVLKDYASVKNNEHDSEQLEKVLNSIDELVNDKDKALMIDIRIGNYGDVEVRDLFHATSDTLVGIRARKEEVKVIEAKKDKKNGEWDLVNAIDNESASEGGLDHFQLECDHGLYVILDAKLQNIRNGTCLGEVNGKTYVITTDGYGRHILYVIGSYGNKKRSSDWDMNIVQFISSDGTFQDNDMDVYNVENVFIYKDGSREVKDEVLRVLSLYPKNGLQKKVKKAFK